MSDKTNEKDEKIVSEFKPFEVILDFTDPEGFMAQVEKLGPRELYALGQQLKALGEKVDAAGIFVTTKLLLAMAELEQTNRPVEGLTSAEEKLFKGKVAQA